MGYSPRGRNEWDTTERLNFHFPVRGRGGILSFRDGHAARKATIQKRLVPIEV